MNAGDAGIASSGNINIAAERLIGTNNIQFGGTSAGVPPDVSNLSASLSGVAAAATSATASAAASQTERRIIHQKYVECDRSRQAQPENELRHAARPNIVCPC